VFAGVSQNVRQGTKLKMSTEGFDMGRFEYFSRDCIHLDDYSAGVLQYIGVPSTSVYAVSFCLLTFFRIV